MSISHNLVRLRRATELLSNSRPVLLTTLVRTARVDNTNVGWVFLPKRWTETTAADLRFRSQQVIEAQTDDWLSTTAV